MSGGKCPGGTCPGGFCPVTIKTSCTQILMRVILELNQVAIFLPNTSIKF